MLSRSVVQKVSNLVFCAREPVRFTGITSGRIQRVNRPISYHSYNIQARSRVPGEIKRREVELDPQVSPEEIMNREVKLLSLRVVPQQQCNGHCPCDSAKARQWRGDTALTLPLFWRRSTVSPVFFGPYPRSSLHSLALFPPCPRP